MLAEIQSWEGIRVHMLHETRRQKILPVTGRKIGSGRCWDCVDLSNMCFQQGQVEEKGQCGQAGLEAMLKVTVFITVAEFHADSRSALPDTVISVQIRQTHTE